MPLLTRNRVALLIALPAFLVPVIEIPLVLWARLSFLSLHPEYMDDPPTISRAINDPALGVPFADLILVITSLIMMALPVMVLAYALAISQLTLGRGKRALLWVMLLLVFVLQVTASTGMVLTTQYTFAIDHDMHMLGSYIFFVFQAVTILVAATLCRILLNEQVKHAIPDHAWQFRPGMHRFRFRFMLLVLGLAALFGVLFVIKDYPLPISEYIVQVIYTQSEVLVIACFVLFFGSYAVDIHDMVRRDKLRLPVSAAATKALTTAEGPAAASGAAVTER